MLTTVDTLAISALPLALHAIPILVLGLVGLVVAKGLSPLLPVAEPARNSIVHAANVAYSAALRLLGLVFLLAFLAVNWIAIHSQNMFETFLAAQQRGSLEQAAGYPRPR
jgi:hypothetical protein